MTTKQDWYQCPECEGLEVRPSRNHPLYFVCETCGWAGEDPESVTIEMGDRGAEVVG